MLPALEAFVAEHPLRESSRIALMRALSAVGRQADALADYRRYRDAIAAELGLEPSEQIQQLELQILRQEIPGPRRGSGEQKEPPQPREAPRSRGLRPLPQPPTTFIGRHSEPAELAALLGDNRLVSAVDQAASVNPGLRSPSPRSSPARSPAASVTWI